MPLKSVPEKPFIKLEQDPEARSEDEKLKRINQNRKVRYFENVGSKAKFRSRNQTSVAFPPVVGPFYPTSVIEGIQIFY